MHTLTVATALVHVTAKLGDVCEFCGLEVHVEYENIPEAYLLQTWNSNGLIHESMAMKLWSSTHWCREF